MFKPVVDEEQVSVMSDTRLSAVIGWSSDGIASAYRVACYILCPNPIGILWVVGLTLVLGTIATMVSLATGVTGQRVLTDPVQLGAIAVLYGIDLWAIYTIAKMLRGARCER